MDILYLCSLSSFSLTWPFLEFGSVFFSRWSDLWAQKRIDEGGFFFVFIVIFGEVRERGRGREIRVCVVWLENQRRERCCVWIIKVEVYGNKRRRSYLRILYELLKYESYDRILYGKWKNKTRKWRGEVFIFFGYRFLFCIWMNGVVCF